MFVPVKYRVRTLRDPLFPSYLKAPRGLSQESSPEPINSHLFRPSFEARRYGRALAALAAVLRRRRCPESPSAAIRRRANRRRGLRSLGPHGFAVGSPQIENLSLHSFAVSLTRPALLPLFDEDSIALVSAE